MYSVIWLDEAKKSVTIGWNTERAIRLDEAKKALLLDETQKEQLDWMKHKVIGLIGGNMYRAIWLDET